jgi:hypothetical protein
VNEKVLMALNSGDDGGSYGIGSLGYQLQKCKVKKLVATIPTPTALVPQTACTSLGVCASLLSPSCKQCLADMTAIQAAWSTNLTTISGCTAASKPSWMDASYFKLRTAADVTKEAQSRMVKLMTKALQVRRARTVAGVRAATGTGMLQEQPAFSPSCAPTHVLADIGPWWPLAARGGVA